MGSCNSERSEVGFLFASVADDGHAIEIVGPFLLDTHQNVGQCETKYHNKQR